jgi:hypothetical protein
VGNFGIPGSGERGKTGWKADCLLHFYGATGRLVSSFSPGHSIEVGNMKLFTKT